MKKQASILAAVLMFSLPARAASVTHTGTINLIRTHDSTSYPSAAEDWIAVNGVTTTGHTCATASGGKVVLLVRDDERGQRMLSIATSALLSGKTVTIGIDDTKKRSGSNFCLLQHITLNP